jgi:hypothetical protein
VQVDAVSTLRHVLSSQTLERSASWSPRHIGGEHHAFNAAFAQGNGRLHHEDGRATDALGDAGKNL